MKQFFVQFKKDFAAYFSGYNAYLTIFSYCLLSFFSALYLGDYFLRETDVMNAYFVMQPSILVLVIPAITMRSWADEIKSGTIELLLTQPVRFSTLVLAKFGAAYVFFLCLVLCSAPFLLITNAFSVLDWGMAVSGYLGLALCGALFSAAGCLVSVCCRSVITSFIGTVFVLFFVSQLDFPVYFTGNFSFYGNYSAFLAGALLWGNFVYFILGTALLLWLNTVMLIKHQTNTSQEKRVFMLFIFLLFIIFVSGNMGAFLWFDRLIDATCNKTYTLTDRNRDYLNTLDKRVDITLYEAKNKREDGNSRYASYAAYTERLLQQFEKQSDGAIRYSVVLVEPFSALERRLIREGMPYQEDNLNNKTYMAMEISDNDGNIRKIDTMESFRQNLLETDIMRLIKQLGQSKKAVALLAAPDDLNEMQGFYNSLNEFYDVTLIDSNVQYLPPTYNAVILINPPSVSYGFLLALDQYILNGGNVIMFYEPALLQKNNDSYLADFLNTFGIKPTTYFILTDNHQSINIAQTAGGGLSEDIRSVLINNAGEVKTRQNQTFSSVPLLAVGNRNLAVLTAGKFDSHYPEYAEETSGLLSHSVQSGQFFFIYDSDLLKDYLYIIDDSKGKGFYQILSLADNQPFYLQLLDKATGSNTEAGLNYPHYAMNLTSVGSSILQSQKRRYQDELNKLQDEIESLKNSLNNMDTASVKNISKKQNLAQDLDDAEDLLNYTKKQIITNYHSTIAGLTFVIVLLIPCLMLGILGVIIFLFSQYQKRKIRRLSAYEITF